MVNVQTPVTSANYHNNDDIIKRIADQNDDDITRQAVNFNNNNDTPTQTTNNTGLCHNKNIRICIVLYCIVIATMKSLNDQHHQTITTSPKKNKTTLTTKTKQHQTKTNNDGVTTQTANQNQRAKRVRERRQSLRPCQCGPTPW